MSAGAGGTSPYGPPQTELNESAAREPPAVATRLAGLFVVVGALRSLAVGIAFIVSGESEFGSWLIPRVVWLLVGLQLRRERIQKLVAIGLLVVWITYQMHPVYSGVESFFGSEPTRAIRHLVQESIFAVLLAAPLLLLLIGNPTRFRRKLAVVLFVLDQVAHVASDVAIYVVRHVLHLHL
jgi:hypothetical protein